jgi:DNA-binding CsgD family transcriptional regulator
MKTMCYDMMKPRTLALVKVRRHYDATFKREAVACWLASGKSAEIVAHEMGLSPARLYAWRSFSNPADDATTFMLRIVRGNLSVADIETHLLTPIGRSELAKLRQAALNAQLSLRRRAQAVIFYRSGIGLAAIMRILILGRNTVKRYIRRFDAGGADALLEPRRWKRGTKAQNPKLREVVLSIIHSPPLEIWFQQNLVDPKTDESCYAGKGLLDR